MNLQGKIKKIEKEKKKLLKAHKGLFEASNEIELYNLVVEKEFSKFYKAVNEKYLCKTKEWDERMVFAQDYRDFLEKITNIEKLQTFINKKSKDNTNGYKVGDILYSNWGYEQTNVEFYQVVATTEKTIYLADIKENVKITGWEQGLKSPCKNAFNFNNVAFKTFSRYPQDSRDGYTKSLFKYKGKALEFTSYC
ncbi:MULTISPECIES: hypothetical protein [Campylobacter]|uniref:hypothetical protein n=1 Tax=Campylobacter TaxID=194 RepID=UPI000874F97F|nr:MULTISPECIES: hypothetical protein [Campylobacter]ECQ5913035.1 hypothetical protein [Campylobacter jejuni]EKY7466875.1 hypothetical protein [Campylobacter jejuni]OEW03456.1 hypothetical protein AJ930_08625 [Campylobacter sp. BCW_6871]RTJ21849.1 hypothetical protein C3H86_08895 [Campylobacter jejuni]HEF4369401.1 hypothetical protein [Campylobacter jejuni]